MIKVVEKADPKFPELLKHIPDAPERLYYKGDWDGIFSAQGGPASGGENCLAVVGSRHMTSYGRRVTEHLVGEVACAGVTIVSGFMYGIDVAAHKAALEAGGKTIAVMPCGIERVHPEYQKDVYERILKNGGLILSEYEGDAMPAYWTYPRRNRIVAGLCKATLVVEAALKSGSLVTAEFARTFGRRVFAVPGPITSEVSKGTVALLREGASLAADADDILEFFKQRSSSWNRHRNYKAHADSDVEQKILEMLHRESLEPDVIARTLRIPAAQLGTALSLMELQGIVKREGGKYYVN